MQFATGLHLRASAWPGVVGLALYAWMIVGPFLPPDGLMDPLLQIVLHAGLLVICGLGLWAFVDHIRERRRLLAFLLVPFLTVVHIIATGVVAMLFTLLATWQMPI